MRPVEDILAECLRRWRHGLVRPLWEDATEETRATWIGEAVHLIRKLDVFGLAIVRKRGTEQ